jgi:hypothetical protein
MQKIKEINKEELQKELNNAKAEIAKMKEELTLEKLDLKKEMEKAHIGIVKAKEELKGYQEMIYAMEKDGLLDTKKGYSILYKDGELFINDKKQPKEVADKYRKYFRKDKVKISKDDEGDFHFNYGSSLIYID